MYRPFPIKVPSKICKATDGKKRKKKHFAWPIEALKSGILKI
jgi:hypothetical protein